MPPIELQARVDPDGTLRLAAPQFAGRTVAIRITPQASSTGVDREEWQRFVRETAGSIDDPTFVEPPDPLPVDEGGVFE